MKSFVFLGFTFAGLLFANSVFAQLEGSPFTGVNFSAAPSVRVEVDGACYHLLAINGVKREEVMNRCEATFGAACSDQFADHFTEMMTGIGLPVGSTVDLRLYVFETHSVLDVPAVGVTAENQETVRINRELDNPICL